MNDSKQATAPPVTIVEFLTARLDEDAAQFDLAAEAEAESCRNDGMPDTTVQEVKEYWLRPGELTEWPRHLREVAAKRAIIDAELDRVGVAHEFISAELADAVRGRAQSRVLSVLASIYSDHPDYRQEWKP